MQLKGDFPMSKSVSAHLCGVLGGFTLSLMAVATPAPAENYLGQIVPVAFTFCPRGTISAEGQLLPINQNQALYSLYGTNFGGDGRTSFGLPDLRTRVPIGEGQGPGLADKTLGTKHGALERTMTISEMPRHSHSVNANNLDGNFAGPGGKLLAAAPPDGRGQETIYSTQPSTVSMSPQMIQPTGGNQPIDIVDPTIVIRYCIVAQGLFPPRN